MAKILKLTEEDINQLVTEALINFLLEMPSIKTAMNARNNAFNAINKELNVNGIDNEDFLSKKADQASRFNNYAFEMLKKTIGTKIQLIISEDDEASGNARFYVGKILDVAKKSTADYIFSVSVVNEFDKQDKINANILVKLNPYYNNSGNLTGSFEDGRTCFIYFSNKKARQVVATLINHKGDDSYLKTI